MPWSWSDRRVPARAVAPAAALAVALLVHVTAIVLAFRPQVSEAYAERYIAQTSRCLVHPPPPVVRALPARLLTAEAQPRCPALLRAGWHLSEPELAWSSSERATLVFTLAPDQPAARLTLHFAQMLGAAADPRSLQVLLDGAPVAASRISHAGPFAVTIPGDRLVPGATHRIELLLKRLHTPESLGLGADRRKLGVALAAIVVE